MTNDEDVMLDVLDQMFSLFIVAMQCARNFL